MEMKEYKFVNLNPKQHISREKDIKEAENTLNQYIREGWTLEQVVSPSDIIGALVAILYKEQ